MKKNLARVKVTINKKGHIPQLGLGPIRRPVLITEELCDHLIKLGYPVKIVQSPIVTKKIEKKDVTIATPVATTSIVNDVVEVKQEEVMQESEVVVADNTVEVQDEPAVEEAVVEEQSVMETEEEKVVVTEEENEEVLVDDPDLSAGAFYTENFLTSKALCKKILSNRQVQYEDSASFVLLKKLVADSNPEVEFVEEETTEEVTSEVE